MTVSSGKTLKWYGEAHSAGHRRCDVEWQRASLQLASIKKKKQLFCLNRDLILDKSANADVQLPDDLL